MLKTKLMDSAQGVQLKTPDTADIMEGHMWLKKAPVRCEANPLDCSARNCGAAAALFAIPVIVWAACIDDARVAEP